MVLKKLISESGTVRGSNRPQDGLHHPTWDTHPVSFDQNFQNDAPKEQATGTASIQTYLSTQVPGPADGPAAGPAHTLFSTNQT